ncbi:S-adenosyl-L-methionine-dependent methyltransferase [Triangularia setosa]|uniref:S-adenosyl-L-methionine-dependent methyltransferase n=1 Tax=Triangularia setosa TaxID=2587417 RepID=A0AAN7A7Q5_9PEZI|nr:S-adenosyl-L-methionine-dependent methyltransferase [Podospora setosa]
MPRLPPSLFWKARQQISPFAPILLPVCRTLDSAANELRWIKQHVNSTSSLVPRKLRIWQACLKRERGMPLQYILGTQPFGPLEILCRPGVLIPRLETESIIYHLSSLIPRPSPQAPPLKILDLCTGTGCIPLLLSSLLFPARTQITGVDISPSAISLSRQNLTHTISLRHLSPSASKSINFTQADIFDLKFLPSLGYKPSELDILVSNPPYISHHGFNTTTERSVRLYEPRLALVPQIHPTSHYNCEPEDIFYAHLLEIVRTLQPKRVLFEVGDLDQAARVVAMVVRGKGFLERYARNVEVWRDEPGVGLEGKAEKMWVGGNVEVEVKGQGRGRGVYFWRE